MANGEWVYSGAVAVSDRTIPMGTKVRIGKDEYTVSDKTAIWVHDKFGLTIDIWQPSCDGFGTYKTNIIIK